MTEILRKLAWALVGLVAGVFMIGFGLCATGALVMGLGRLSGTDGDRFVILILAVIGEVVAWGFFTLARYCARQIPAEDGSDKAGTP